LVGWLVVSTSIIIIIIIIIINVHNLKVWPLAA
jgi:hypothetical protein